MRRRLVLLLLALAAVFGPGQALADGGSGGANSAIAINTKDNSSLFDLAFAIRHVMGDTVDQQNAAVAYASCNSCQTTAIAIEIVLVEGSPTTVSPTNVALSENVSCTLCDTFATAYQFVIGTNGPVHFSEDGLRELHAIRQEIESWGKQGLSNEQIQALLPEVIDRLKTVLATQLVPDGNAQPHQNDESSQSTTTNAQPNAPPNGTPTATTETGTVDTTTVPTTTAATTTAPPPPPTTTTAPTTTGATTTTP
jgi:putative peptide zinc metalloprotease protein